MSGKVAAFESFGAKLPNDRWAWSAIASDNRVVLQLWKDRLKRSGEPPCFRYSTFNDPNRSFWQSLPGNRQRIDHLKFAQANCDGRFSVVIGVAKDTQVQPRETAEAYPSKIEMRLIELNEETGEFSAEQVVSETTG
jgi:hypothetical protein